MKRRHFTIPVFIPMQACPFRCIFCDQEKISGHPEIPTPDDVKIIIERHLETIPDSNNIIELGFFGGTFTGLPISQQHAYFDAAKPFVHTGKIASIRLSTRPDFINDKILDFLKTNHVRTIELGAQSMKDEVLNKSGRGHTAADTVAAAEKIVKNGFRLGLQMMIGLPGDTKENTQFTARQFVGLGAKDVRIYPLLVIKGTLLENLYKSGQYIPLSLEEAVKITVEVYKIFEAAGVNIIRTGLHPSKGLLSGDDLIAGPFHVSFKELVLSEIWREQLSKIIKPEAFNQIDVFVAGKELNYAIGHQSSNKNLLLKKFQKVNFKIDKSLKNREYHVDLY
jgi:histone acetyltransferase (RNA polymerase elongator complex component)